MICLGVKEFLNDADDTQLKSQKSTQGDSGKDVDDPAKATRSHPRLRIFASGAGVPYC
jgi:hypothetical protein